MSININDKKGEIAKTVLLAGDPLRSKYITDNFLSNVKLVNQTRNAFYFTGMYKDKMITVGASGMGCPSIGIYSYELYTEFEVDCIIRIGTCGAYTTDLKLFDLINVSIAVSESTYAKYAWGIEEEKIAYQGSAYSTIQQTAASMNIPLIDCSVHSSDIFYRKNMATPIIATKHHCLAVEMESFALFANAQYLNKTAASLLSVSDIIPTHEKISSEQREVSLLPMIHVALETCLRIN